MPAPEYSLSDTLEPLQQSAGIGSGIMELTLLVESQGHAETSENIRGALPTIGNNEGHIRQGLAKLRPQHRGDA